MSLITTAWITNKIALINSARIARGFGSLSVSFVKGESITVDDTTTKINTFINATKGTSYTTSPWSAPVKGSKIKQAHFNAFDQLTADINGKTKCKNCGNVCVSTCTTGGCIGSCTSCNGCSGCSSCHGCGAACAGGCGSCSGGACWGCGGGCTSCSGCSGCSSCNGCSGCSSCGGCSSSCQATCNTICTNNCSGTCGTGCTTTARLGVIG